MTEFIDAFFNIDVIVTYYPILLKGLRITLELSALVVPIGFIAGLALGISNSFRIRSLSISVFIWIDFFRSFPPIVLLILIFYGGPFIGLKFSAFAATCLALVLNSSSYYGEIIRSGIAGVGVGQWEAARSTGLTLRQALFHVVIPQGIRRVIPPLVSNSLELVKATSIATAVALPELLRSAKIAQGLSYNPTPLIAAALIYFILLWPIVRLLSRLELRLVAVPK